MAARRPTFDVSTPTTSISNMRRTWELPTALMEGTHAMRRAHRRWLPQEEGESTDAYDARLKRTVLLNGYRRTVEAMTGKVFSKPIIKKDDVPSQIVDWCENIDLEGQSLDLFAEKVFGQGLTYGHSHFMVDMQKSIPGATLKDEQDLGLRPYFVNIKPQNVLGWRAQKVRGVYTLTQLRIYDAFLEQDGDWGEQLVEEIRVYTPGFFEVWRLSKKSRWERVDGGSMGVPYIPLVTFYAKRTGFMESKVPLQDLADINVAHWQSSSDQRHILHVARVPLLFGKGFSNLEGKDQIEVGPNRLIKGPENSDLKYVEHTGAAIASGENDLRSLEDAMRLMGLELLITAPGGQTATAKSLDYADINSPLQFMALSMGDAIELGFQYMSDWAKMGQSGGSVKMNTDYGITLRDAADVQSLLQARLAGEISREAFWAEMKRRNILMDDFDFTKEKALLKKEEEEAMANALATDPRLPGIGDNVTGAGNDARAAAA